jgi:hypothetical protein
MVSFAAASAATARFVCAGRMDEVDEGTRQDRNERASGWTKKCRFDAARETRTERRAGAGARAHRRSLRDRGGADGGREEGGRGGHRFRVSVRVRERACDDVCRRGGDDAKRNGGRRFPMPEQLRGALRFLLGSGAEKP